MWIVNVKKVEDRCAVWLSEVEGMESGVVVATGRTTPSFVGTAGGDLATVEDSLRKSLDVLRSESMLAFDSDILTVGCMVGEDLGDLLLGDGGDDSVE